MNGKVRQNKMLKIVPRFLTWAAETMDCTCIGEASWRRSRFVGYVLAFSFRLLKNQHIFKDST